MQRGDRLTRLLKAPKRRKPRDAQAAVAALGAGPMASQARPASGFSEKEGPPEGRHIGAHKGVQESTSQERDTTQDTQASRLGPAYH